ncbi:hypothetical protein [Mycoplasmopsis canis]|uniref:hypothetical protein n=1 Tax=Mycoplasmopsis canis TaxID=29555 RepID=UPI0002FEFBBC|nr:hypothetical protein [Mycoplasmopsis canis]
MKLLKKMFLTLILPIIIVPTISLSPNSKRSDDDIKYKLNKKLFEPYYKRLGLENVLKNNKFRIPEKYDKVGILEPENFDHNSLISTNNKNFKFHNLSKTKENDENKSLHAYSVSSIIGTDLGININAEIYFDSNLNTSNILDKIKNMKENFGVSIFNCSWGFSDLSDNITKHFENYISADVEQINNELLNKNKEELLILNQIALSFFYYI